MSILNKLRTVISGSLHFKIPTFILLIIGTVLFIYGTIAINEHRDTTWNLAVTSGQDQVALLAELSKAGFVSGEHEKLRLLAELMAQRDSVSRCIIYDAKGTPLVQVSNSQPTVVLQNMVTVSAPVQYNNQQLGLAELHLDLNPVLQQIQRTSHHISIGLIIALVFIGIFISFFIHYRLVDPFVSLTRLTEKIASGHFAITQQGTRKDEIGSLARAINAMSRSLQESYHTLEQRVAERTAELSTAKHAAERVNEQWQIISVELQALLDSSPVGILFVTPDRIIQRANLEFCTITGYSQEELQGKSTRIFYSCQKEFEAAEELTYRLLRIEGLCETTSDLLRKDGTIATCSLRGRVTHIDGQAKGIIWSVEDIGSRLQMEEELLKIKKLESISVLTSGIAHDFNNILVAVLGNISLAERFSKDNPKVIELLTAAREASVRAKDLTTKLSTFSQGVDPVRTTEFLPDIIKESASLTLSGTNVACQFNLAPDLWAVQMEKSQISQVIHNLVLNSIQAMKEGGNLYITCNNYALSINEIGDLQPGSYVRLDIIDTGIGIPIEHLGNIFDPYFSTKEKDFNKGSGLGLSLVHSLVVKHGGNISVESTPGSGTTFTLYLPAIHKDSLPQGESPLLTTGKGGLLVLDNEEAHCQSLREMATLLGYSITFTSSLDETITAMLQQPENHKQIKAAILDITLCTDETASVLPQLKQLRKLDQELILVAAITESTHPIHAGYLDHGFQQCFIKPYRFEDLTQLVSGDKN